MHWPFKLSAGNKLIAEARQACTRDWLRIGLWLVVCTLGYNLIEALISIGAGLHAGSIVLISFGLDSMIESVAAGLLLWRLRVEASGAEAEVIERTEHRVFRFVGLTFLVLALYVVGQAGYTLWAQRPPEESIIGIAVAVLSLIVMPLVSWGKLRAAKEIGSTALRTEAKETIACSYLSLTLLVGLAVNAALGWWWADPVAALLMVPWLIREGLEAIHGETSCGHD